MMTYSNTLSLVRPNVADPFSVVNSWTQIEVYILYGDSLKNYAQFIPLNSYTGKYYTSCSIEEFNKLLQNDETISLIDKSFVFLILNNFQYFQFYNTERNFKSMKTVFQYHLTERLYKPFYNYPIRMLKIKAKTTVTIFLLSKRIGNNNNKRGMIITKNKLYFRNNQLVKVVENKLKKEINFNLISY